MLEKGEVSASDLAETQERNRVCLDAAGFTDIEHFTNGGMSLTPPVGIPDDQVQELVMQCSDESGLTQVETLYATILVNPNNEDMDELATQCLIEQGIVEPSFTASDLRSWYEQDDPRLLTGGAAANCTYDPLRRTGEW